jgi:Ca2+-binding EF-hand superfamily protein
VVLLRFSLSLEKLFKDEELRPSEVLAELSALWTPLTETARWTDEFTVGMQEFGIQLSKNDAQILFTYFDRDGDGSICFDEFLVGVRGKPNARRQALVDKAFLKFDRDGNGYIDINDLRGIYNCSHHPKVRSGQMTEDQALGEFLQNFNDRNGDGRIQKEEWDEYYASVSSSIDNDEHFVQLMRTAWRLD